MKDIIPMGEAFLKPLQPRDSILIADQFEYGVLIKPSQNVQANSSKPKANSERANVGTIQLADMKQYTNDSLVLIRDWQIDSLKDGSLSASVVVAPFEEGLYALPSVYVYRQLPDGQVDTLRFSGTTLEVKTMPVDTASFEVFPIKPQANYPLTFAEVAPYVGGALLGIALIFSAIKYLPRLFKKKEEQAKPKDPAHIVALRELERFRSEKYWSTENQKAFYSGVTDILKTYMSEAFQIDTLEKTTDELFNELKNRPELTAQMYASLKELFERGDLVKFAKASASEQENAQVLPLCVSFVTSTYQMTLEKEAKENVL